MRTFPVAIALGATVIFVQACVHSESELPDRVRAEDFLAYLEVKAGADAEFCGRAFGGSEGTVNACVAQAFEEGRAAYGVYDLNRTESTVVRAARGKVSHYEIDKDRPASERQSASFVHCLGPSLSGVIDGFYLDVFECESLSRTNP